MKAILVAGAVLAGTAALASPAPPLPGEGALFEAVNGLPGTAVPRIPIEVVMQLGAIWTVPLSTALVAFVALRARGGADALGVVLAALLGAPLTWWVTNQVKDMMDRPRPASPAVEVIQREAPHGWGYPSGHSSVAAALAVVAFAVMPARWRWLPVALAVGVGFARMYVGVHYPLDVLGGWALGVIVGAAAMIAARRAIRGAIATPYG